MFDIRHASARFEEILDSERRILLAGDLDQLPALAARKQAALRRLVGSGADRSQLSRLRRKSQANQLLLEAAGRGIRAGTEVLAGLRRPAATLCTYDRTGARQTDAGAGAGAHLHRRA